MSTMDDIIEILEELKEDSTVPKNVRARVVTTLSVLKSEDELRIKVDKALQEMEEISNDNNTMSYTRAQIWNVVSLLEAL